ncbi:hypothetical protein [Helicobacter sp. T3_23-1056]
MQKKQGLKANLASPASPASLARFAMKKILRWKIFAIIDFLAFRFCGDGFLWRLDFEVKNLA